MPKALRQQCRLTCSVRRHNSGWGAGRTRSECGEHQWTRLHWERGLLRAWIVASAVWISCVGWANQEAFIPPHTVSPPSGAATAHTPLPPDVTDHDPADNGIDTGIPIKAVERPRSATARVRVTGCGGVGLYTLSQLSKEDLIALFVGEAGRGPAITGIPEFRHGHLPVCPAGAGATIKGNGGASKRFKPDPGRHGLKPDRGSPSSGGPPVTRAEAHRTTIATCSASTWNSEICVRGGPAQRRAIARLLRQIPCRSAQVVLPQPATTGGDRECRPDHRTPRK